MYAFPLDWYTHGDEIHASVYTEQGLGLLRVTGFTPFIYVRVAQPAFLHVYKRKIEADSNYLGIKKYHVVRRKTLYQNVHDPEATFLFIVFKNQHGTF